MSADEDHPPVTGPTPEMTSPPGTSGGQFRFPKTKKSLAADWLQESNDSMASPNVQNDDDVSANYLRGSRSPPGIATHLLRATAPMSPVKNVCSAKKRWLRQAISEDHTDETPVNGNASPSDACFADYVTPLKKRRLASYKDEQVIHATVYPHIYRHFLEKYSNHLKTGLVWYSNGQKLSGSQMVWYSNGI